MKKESLKTRIIQIAAMTFALAFGGGLLWLTVPDLHIWWKVDNYRSISGMVTHTEIDKVRRQAGKNQRWTEWRPIIHYAYTVQTQRYTGRDQLNHMESAEAANKALHEYRSGTAIAVYYDPDHPSISLMFKENVSLWGNVLGALLGLFCLWAFGVGVKTMYQERKQA